jgi:NDP-sugar pyrophosphorylase family protein
VKVIILCGGLASRLGNLTRKIPKSLISINNKPFIIYQIEKLRSYGFKNFILCVGHKNYQIKNLLGNGIKYGVKIEYSYDGKKLLGTAGAIKKALKLVDHFFIIINGDSYLLLNPNHLVKKFKKIRKPIVVITKNNKKNLIANILIKKKKIINYSKSGIQESFYIDYGMQIFNKNLAWPNLKKNKPYDMSYVYNLLINKKLLYFYNTRKPFFEIGSLKGLAEFKKKINDYK